MRKTNLMLVLFWLTIFGMSCQQASQTKETNVGEELPGVDATVLVDPYLRYNQFDAEIKVLAPEHDLDWLLVKAVIIKESHFDAQFISTAGAVGLMQLMPREGSYISEAYRNYAQSRLQKRNAAGERVYRGKQDQEWADLYRAELDSLQAQYEGQAASLYALDARFDPTWNLRSGIQQLANDYQYFRRRGHGPYGSRIYALAAYNAGRGAVVKEKANRQYDRIPINRQTELYVGYIERIYVELQKHKGAVNQWNDWILKI